MRDTSDEAIVGVSVVVVIGVWVLFFVGDPDLMDAVIAVLMGLSFWLAG